MSIIQKTKENHHYINQNKKPFRSTWITTDCGWITKQTDTHNNMSRRFKKTMNNKKQGEGGYSIVAVIVVVLLIDVGHFLKEVKWWHICNNYNALTIFKFFKKNTQVDDSGHRMPRDPAGKSPDPAGKHRKSLERGSSTPAANCPYFFRWIPVNFLCFLAVTSRKSSEKIRKISSRNTASTKSPELPGTGSFRTGLFDLGCLTCSSVNFFSLNSCLPCWIDIFNRWISAW